jgi:hypothetical protein
VTQATDSLSLPSGNAAIPYTKSDHIVGTIGTYGDIDPSTFFDAFTVTSSQDIDSRFMTTSSTMTPLGRLDSFDFQEQSITHTGWSPNLPDLATTRRLWVVIFMWYQYYTTDEMLYHRVQAFFAFHIHAGRLFHGPSFLASLNLHPLNERFPSVAVLHALCSVGSTFVAEIVPTPVHTHSSFPCMFFFSYLGDYRFDGIPDVIFHGRWRRVASRPDSFAEHHAKLAKHAVGQLLDSGEHMISTLQGWI